MPQRGVLYAELRREMARKDVDDQYLAQELNLSPQTVARRFENRKGYEWKLPEIYHVCDILDQPYSAIPRLFPYYPSPLSCYARRKKR